LAGLFGLAYGLILGPSDWSSPLVLGSLLGGAAGCVLFLVVESRQREPLVPLGLFRSPLVSGANLATLLLYSALNGVMFFLVLNLQQVQGYPPSTAGLALLPAIASIALLSGPAGSLADRIGPRLQMIAGPMVVALGTVLLAIAGATTVYARDLLPGVMLVGIGMAVVIAPLTKSALSVGRELSGTASGFNNAVARIAALLAVALLGAIMVSTFTGRLSASVAESGLSPEQQSEILVQSDKLGGIVIPEPFDDAARLAARQAVSDSFAHGFRLVMIASALLALGAAVVSFLTIRGPASKNDPL
jgi:predicted MFS family arabinose efflux permease